MRVRNLQNQPDANFGNLSGKNKQLMFYNSSTDDFQLKDADSVLVNAAVPPPLPSAFVAVAKRGKEEHLVIDYGTF